MSQRVITKKNICVVASNVLSFVILYRAFHIRYRQAIWTVVYTKYNYIEEINSNEMNDGMRLYKCTIIQACETVCGNMNENTQDLSVNNNDIHIQDNSEGLDSTVVNTNASHSTPPVENISE